METNGTIILIIYLLHPVLHIDITQIFAQMTIIHSVISWLTDSHFNEGRKMISGTNKTASYKYFHSVWSNKKILCYIIINSNESSRFSLCHQFSLEGKYYCVQYLSSLFTRRCSTERSPHKHTMILSSVHVLARLNHVIIRFRVTRWRDAVKPLPNSTLKTSWCSALLQIWSN